MSDFDDRVGALSTEIENLKLQIDRKRKKDITMTRVIAAGQPTLAVRSNSNRVCRTLKGHYGKVYAMQWSGSGDNIVSASQGGQLILWNADSTNKVQAVELRTSWVMACAMEQKQGKLMACGGLDNICSIYRVERTANISAVPTDDPGSDLLTELADGHTGYISDCRFLDGNRILTSSGDGTCLLWDISKNVVSQSFTDHCGDVMSIAPHPTDDNTFVTGSIDKTSRVWDVRQKRCAQTHFGHESDINSVAFFSDGKAFGTGSEDNTCCLFDLRSYGEVRRFGGLQSPVTAVDFSKSGRFLFAGSVDHNAYGYDVLGTTAEPTMEFSQQGHDDRVTCLQVSPTGDALCTGGWDNNLKIWA